LGENKSTDIGKSHRLRKESNHKIDKVSAIRPGVAKKMRRHIFQYKINDVKRSFLKQRMFIELMTLTPGRSNEFIEDLNQSMNGSSTLYAVEKQVEMEIGVARATLPIMRTRPPVALQLTIRT
jgi:5-methylcytosine-specific restriction endonuclease McrBC GTP-binding regulatory subunit McrB